MVKYKKYYHVKTMSCDYNVSPFNNFLFFLNKRILRTSILWSISKANTSPSIFSPLQVVQHTLDPAGMLNLDRVPEPTPAAMFKIPEQKEATGRGKGEVAVNTCSQLPN